MVLNPNDPTTPLTPNMSIGQQLNSLGATPAGVIPPPQAMPPTLPMQQGMPATLAAAQQVPGLSNNIPSATAAGTAAAAVPDASGGFNKGAMTDLLKQSIAGAQDGLKDANKGLGQEANRDLQMVDMMFSHQPSKPNTPQGQYQPITINAPSMITSDRNLKMSVKPAARSIQKFLEQLYGNK